jgi:hypothetical protein
MIAWVILAVLVIVVFVFGLLRSCWNRYRLGARGSIVDIVNIAKMFGDFALGIAILIGLASKIILPKLLPWLFCLWAVSECIHTCCMCLIARAGRRHIWVALGFGLFLTIAVDSAQHEHWQPLDTAIQAALPSLPFFFTVAIRSVLFLIRPHQRSSIEPSINAQPDQF